MNQDQSKIIKCTLKSNQENQTINNISNLQLTAQKSLKNNPKLNTQFIDQFVKQSICPSTNGFLAQKHLKSIKLQQILQKNTEFFYKNLPQDYKSQIIPSWMNQPVKDIFWQSILPSLICFFLYLFVWFIQTQKNDFCFDAFKSFCACDTYATKFWTFSRQMIVWKLGMISYKKINVKFDLKQKNNSNYIEPFLLYLFVVGLDFVLVLFLYQYSDFAFLVLIFVIVSLIILHTMSAQIFNIFLLYDVNLIIILLYISYIIPEIYYSLVDNNGSSGKNLFVYIYPLTEWVIEIFTNYVLEHASIVPFFQYQLHLMILGMKIGIITSIDMENFEFWYLSAVFVIKKVLQSTNVLNIVIRRHIFNLFPPFIKHYVSLKEISETRKGKEGFMLEMTFIWIVMYYWWWGTQSIVPAQVHSIISVQNCKFEYNFNNIQWYQPFIIWCLLIVAQSLSIFVNNITRFDSIKWIGVKEMSLFDNVMMRMTGWYFFQISLVIALNLMS